MSARSSLMSNALLDVWLNSSTLSQIALPLVVNFRLGAPGLVVLLRPILVPCLVAFGRWYQFAHSASSAHSYARLLPLYRARQGVIAAHFLRVVLARGVYYKGKPTAQVACGL